MKNKKINQIKWIFRAIKDSLDNSYRHWNYLMDVVEIIEDLGYCVYIYSNVCHIQKLKAINEFEPLMIVNVTDPKGKFSACLEAVKRFVAMYEQGKIE